MTSKTVTVGSSVGLHARPAAVIAQAASLSLAAPEPIRVGDTVTLPLAALDARGNPIRAARVT